MFPLQRMWLTRGTGHLYLPWYQWHNFWTTDALRKKDQPMNPRHNDPWRIHWKCPNGIRKYLQPAFVFQRLDKHTSWPQTVSFRIPMQISSKQHAAYNRWVLKTGIGKWNPAKRMLCQKWTYLFVRLRYKAWSEYSILVTWDLNPEYEVSTVARRR